MSLFRSFTDYVTGKSKKKTGNLPTDPLTGNVAPYNKDYLQFANNVANTGSFVPYSPETIKSYGYGDVLQQPTNQTGGDSSVNYEQQQKDSLMGQIREKYNLLQGVFNNLFGGIDNKAKEQSDLLNQNYDRQQEELGKSYENAAKQTSMMMGARGLGSSSYNVDAQNTNTDTFNRSTTDILQNRQQGLGGIGQWVAGQKQNLGSMRDQYNDAYSKMGQFDLNGLNSLFSGISNGLTGAQNMAPNYLTQGEAINSLNQIQPVQNQGTSQLASKLQALVTSSAPIFAKRQIAQGLVKAANLTDPGAVSYWNNAFEDMLRNNGMG